MFRPVNCTSITLVPKSLHASSIKLYRPISCYNVLYKIIFKIIANRMKEVVGKVIDPAQAGFIPYRSILDNILLVSELIKGYGTKGLSLHCLIKINVRKACD